MSDDLQADDEAPPYSEMLRVIAANIVGDEVVAEVLAQAADHIDTLRKVLEATLPSLRSLAAQQCPDPEVAASDRKLLAIVEEACAL